MQGTQNPDFNERFIFPMITNDQQLRLLSRSKLLLTMVDLNGEEQGDEGDDAGLIGDVNVSLNEIAEGGRYRGDPTMHHIQIPSQHTLPTHPLKTPYHHILLTYSP